MVNKTAIKILTDKGLRVTPQRIAILDIILNLNNHPTTEDITEYLRINYPRISESTVYKILDAFVKNGIITKVKTENGIIRFDPVTETHHHLYSSDSEQIEDFFDDELNKILDDYFQKKPIPDFKIEDIKVHIKGIFTGNLKQKKQAL
jgi:Fur family transcriptional regulator, peroxide stress response regulator